MKGQHIPNFRRVTCKSRALGGEMQSIDAARAAIQAHGGATKDTTPRAPVRLTERIWREKA